MITKVIAEEEAYRSLVLLVKLCSFLLGQLPLLLGQHLIALLLYLEREK